MWDNVPDREAAHRRFRIQLEERALKNLLKDPERLAGLRNDWDGLRALKKSLSNALKEWKIDLDKEVLKASTPCWTRRSTRPHRSHRHRVFRSTSMSKTIRAAPTSRMLGRR